MNEFKAAVTVVPKAGVLDTQGKAVEKTLRSSWMSVSNVRVGKYITLTIEAEDEGAAAETARRIADDMLVNDLVETFTVEIVGGPK